MELEERTIMSLLSKEELRNLVADHPGPCVSIYMPTHRSGEDTRQDPIRFKNLLRKAEEKLVQYGLRKVDARTLLEPAQELQGYSPFWRHLGDGLAYFIAQDVHQGFTPPHRFDELLVVADQFYVKPLLPLLIGDGHFYILALSQNQVRLLEGTREGGGDVQLEELPGSLSEVLGDVDREKQLQFHEEQRAAWGRFEQLQGTGQASQEIEEIVPAAFHGRVESLFVDLGLQFWGRYDPETNQVRLGDQAAEGNDDLLQFVSIHTLANRGDVYTLSQETGDIEGHLSAVFRY